MKGTYRKGMNNAHKGNKKHKRSFNTPMFGTFNIKTDARVTDFKPALIDEDRQFWLLRITQGEISVYGWAYRWGKSRAGLNQMEVLSKRLLPEKFKRGELDIEVLEKWPDDERNAWAKNVYWWQTFPWSPKQRADSASLWSMINCVDWSGRSVLDIGTHYGYHAFQASKAGAFVNGVDKSRSALGAARIINDRIEMQDVAFTNKALYDSYDIILYLSVHHQFDPEYSQLEKTINRLRKMASRHVFVELIMPPTFGAMSEEEIDGIVGGKILGAYKHNVRGRRKLYHYEH